MNDTPQRIGDAERDAAVQALRAHHEAGRLDMAEFEERMTTALSARTQDQLTPLFVDLPPVDANPRALAVPSATTVTQPEEAGSEPERSAAHRVLGVVSAVIWPAIIILNFAVGWRLWWLFLIPVFLLPALYGALGNDDQRKRRRELRGR